MDKGGCDSRNNWCLKSKCAGAGVGAGEHACACVGLVRSEDVLVERGGHGQCVGTRLLLFVVLVVVVGQEQDLQQSG